MADVAAGGRLPAPPQTSGRRRAAGIYGAIITAAILDTAGGRLPTDVLVVGVVASLVVYWLAEQYAEVLGGQVAGGAVPTWDYIREQLAATWPMVSASFLPLLALVLARVAGASALAAANVGLVVVVVLLTGYAWAAGRSAGCADGNSCRYIDCGRPGPGHDRAQRPRAHPPALGSISAGRRQILPTAIRAGIKRQLTPTGRGRGRLFSFWISVVPPKIDWTWLSRLASQS